MRIPPTAQATIRLIHIKIDPSETETAERIWKTQCATLMISQKGCISEKLLRARERGEFISYSEWETEADIERYTNSSAHKQIVSHTRSGKFKIHVAGDNERQQDVAVIFSRIPSQGASRCLDYVDG